MRDEVPPTPRRAREIHRMSRVRVMVKVKVRVKVRFRVQKYLVFDP